MKVLNAIVTMLLFAPLGAMAGDYGNYSGHGGMAAYKIPSNVYEYHYDKGFTGPDAMGWDPNLQFAWSRLAAAKSCGIPADQTAILKFLQEKYNQSAAIQEIVGVGFHEAQVKADSKFCTPERVDELKLVIPDLERGVLEERFKTGS